MKDNNKIWLRNLIKGIRGSKETENDNRFNIFLPEIGGNAKIYILGAFSDHENNGGKNRSKGYLIEPGEVVFNTFLSDKNKNLSDKIFFLSACPDVDDYIAGIELNTTSIQNYDAKYLKSSKLVSELKILLKDHPDYYRIDIQNKSISGYIVFIKVPTVDNANKGTVTVDGTIYDVTNLLNYFICSDSRTYKGVVYYPVYKSMSSSDESENEVLPHNLLIYGARGTGKSYYITEQYEKYFFGKVGFMKKYKEYQKKGIIKNLLRMMIIKI